MNHRLRCIARFLLLSIGCSLLTVLTATAQPDRRAAALPGADLGLPPQFFRFVLVTGAVQETKHRNTEGDYRVRSSLQPCWEGGIDYQHGISQNLFYVLGAHLVVPGRSTVFDVPALPGNPAHFEEDPPMTDKPFDIGLAVPLLIEQHWVLTPRKAVYGSAGVQGNLALNRNFDEFSVALGDTTGGFVQVFHQLAFTYNNDKPWLTARVRAGMLWVLKHENLLGIGLTANFSFTDYTRGTYEVTIPGRADTKGIYTARGSYIGIDVSYGLTGKFRRKTGE